MKARTFHDDAMSMLEMALQRAERNRDKWALEVVKLKLEIHRESAREGKKIMDAFEAGR